MREHDGKVYREFRCHGEDCRQLLGEEYIYNGRLRIKCPKCGKMNEIDFRSSRQELLNMLKPFPEGGDN